MWLALQGCVLNFSRSMAQKGFSLLETCENGNPSPFFFGLNNRNGELAWLVMGLAAKPDKLSSIPRTHNVGQN